ncbi:RNA polymerase sigma factor [Parapedobacter indicus]|uniref:RNA polymerase sigma-70 factor, ECF subfamily n=1 Tax=Parapedobacter indicus TaxID=1477437 RepID=A0A1I3K3G6_9SPHI|nr:RNA polymerase sigma-70 factor [Parapedobacter indicus]PPL01699.1 RNA polymerase sigma-70 factor (ECF subfamily) [Parapedobacter indicus]SFI66966.1 RNA polymerase sigma-70 factor, ECF subfamily [Parapedobacter indicus]
MKRSSDPFNEKDLLERMRNGDVYAFHEIYDRYKDPLARRVLLLLKADELVQDVLQDLFLKVWEHRSTIDPDRSFRAYLFRIVSNQVTDIFRKLHREIILQEQLLHENPDSYYHIEEEVISKENIRLIRDALLKLPERQREIFVLHKLDGKSYKEISEELGIEPATINQHIYRAMQHLNRLVNPKLPFIALFLSIFLLEG